MVKEYPITEDRLDNIGNLRLSSALFSSAGSLGLGFVISTMQSLSLAGGSVDVATKATWTAWCWSVGFFTIVAYAAAAFYFIKGKSAVDYVKENTVHDED